MRPAFLLALLLVASLAPLPTAQAASWSVEAKVAVTSETSADYTWAIGLTTPTRLRLPMPDNATFVEARDVDGRKLEASADASEVTVTSGTKPFTIHFDLQAEVDGPFSIFPAQVASASDSPVSISITLPTGWRLAGYRDTDDRKPDATATFSGTGPAYVQFLALSPGFEDAGPAAGVAGDIVRREGIADVRLDGATWTIVTTYDTDVYGRSWDVHVPEGATVLSATSPFGPLPTRREGDKLHLTTPYPVGYGLGGRSFTVEMSLAAPKAHGGTFRELNLSVRAADADADHPGDDVHLRATLAPGLQYAGARVAGGVETSPLTFFGRGPVSVGLAFLPPPSADHVQFSDGPFVVDAPRALESAARATARNASELLPRVAGFAYDPADTRPFYVAYTDADVFQWEEGFYSNGLNTITIRASTLEDASDGKVHVVPVGVLVHEATHGLVDRRLPDAPHELSFLHEGLSRLAETHLESYFATDSVVECQGNSCTRHSARPSADELQSYHAAGTQFDVAWRASDVPDSQRGALYDYSGLVLHAFERRAPAGALSNALAFVNGTTFPEDAAAASTALLDIFLRNAPGTPSTAFLYPGREASGLTADQFRYCMNGFVAPPYPWEESRAPSGGCPASGYGARDAQLPAPPVREDQRPIPAPVFEPEPIVQPPPPTTDETRPSDDGTTTSTPGDPQAPGAVVQPSSDSGQAPAPGSEVPGFGVAPLALAVVLAFALVTLRRRS